LTIILSACGAPQAGSDSVAPQSVRSSNTTSSRSDYLGATGGLAEYDMMVAEDGGMGGSVSMPQPAPASANDPGANQNQQSGDLANRKLIKNANLSVETESFDDLLVAIEQRITSLNGYMENFNVSNYSRYNNSNTAYNRYASMTIRIPAVNYDFFMREIDNLSNVLNRSESTRDVTLEYVDIESRKDALTVEYDRLLVLLERAETIDDIIRLESRMSDVRYQIEWMASSLRTYDNLVDYSTIYLDVSEVKELTPVHEQSTWEKIATGFVNSLKGVGNGFRNFFINFIIASPYLVVIAVFIVIIVIIIKVVIRIVKKKMANRPPRPPMPPHLPMPPRPNMPHHQPLSPKQNVSSPVPSSDGATKNEDSQ
jgi:RNAse (barnase) inhibitor barstar